MHGLSFLLVVVVDHGKIFVRVFDELETTLVVDVWRVLSNGGGIKIGSHAVVEVSAVEKLGQAGDRQ